jgi:hypothetical protein
MVKIQIMPLRGITDWKNGSTRKQMRRSKTISPRRFVVTNNILSQCRHVTCCSNSEGGCAAQLRRSVPKVPVLLPLKLMPHSPLGWLDLDRHANRN